MPRASRLVVVAYVELLLRQRKHNGQSRLVASAELDCCRIGKNKIRHAAWWFENLRMQKYQEPARAPPDHLGLDARDQHQREGIGDAIQHGFLGLKGDAV